MLLDPVTLPGAAEKQMPMVLFFVSSFSFSLCGILWENHESNGILGDIKVGAFFYRKRGERFEKEGGRGGGRRAERVRKETSFLKTINYLGFDLVF